MKEVIGITECGERFTLAEFVGTGWSLMNSQWLLQSSKNSNEDHHIFELVGNKMVGNHTILLHPLFCLFIGHMFKEENTIYTKNSPKNLYVE